MERRAAPIAALVLLLTLSGAAIAARSHGAVATAPVAWPPSTLLVSEVQTGGASASDEFVELTNAGSMTVDLVGLEVVYVTATGGTITRKATWPIAQPLEPGHHVLIANAAGLFAAVADVTYSGGFAATGGALVLRPIGGAPVDAVGWGDATNGFVEGGAATAPAAGSSIERLPGGLDGNTVDTNDNGADWFVQANPNPQSLAAPPTPAPGPSVAPTASSGPASSLEPSPSGGPTASPSAAPTPNAPTPNASTPAATPDATLPPAATESPTATMAPPTDEPSPGPPTAPPPSSAATSTPDATGTPDTTVGPSGTPGSTATPGPTGSDVATPSPAVTLPPTIAIAEARALATGGVARISGVLTTGLAALESGRKGFVQDDTGGIALYLDAPATDAIPAGARILVEGTVDERFSERTLRIRLADVVVLGVAPQPEPWPVLTGEISEPVEGFRAVVQGVTVGSPTDLADGLGLLVDDGTGQVRVIVAPPALGGLSIPAGTPVVAIGPVGQRDSTGSGTTGYRVHATEPGDFGIVQPPMPTTTPTPTPAPTGTPVPSASSTVPPTVSPTTGPTASSPTPTPTPQVTVAPTQAPSSQPVPTISILEAREAGAGTVVAISGVVTAEAGRLGTPPLMAIADATAGIVVRLPEGLSAPARGSLVSVRGPLADPYGQLEIRPPANGFVVTGQGSLPTPRLVVGVGLDESTEGLLVQLTATVTAVPRKSTSGDLTIDLVDAAGTPIRVIADASSQIAAVDLQRDATYRLMGIVGQRASRKGALDGYRLYVRDRGDLEAVVSGTGPVGTVPPTTAIRSALGAPDGTPIAVEGSITAGATLLDSTRRRIVIQDASGAIQVLLPPGASSPAVGERVRVVGAVGRAWGAPQIAAKSISWLGGTDAPAVLSLSRAPAERDEWLLVRLSGTIGSVQRLGDHWRADVLLASGARALVIGQAGAAIPSTAIVSGRRITVTGIVRRPYPTASDRRFALLPRSRGDVAIGPAENGRSALSAEPESATGAAPGAPLVTPDTDLAVLAEHVGEHVRVGGLVARLDPDGFDLDDGTALGYVILRDDLADVIPELGVGDAVAVSGVVELVDGTAVVIAGADGSIVRIGLLGEALPIGLAKALPTGGAGPRPYAAASSGSLVVGTGAGLASLLALSIAGVALAVATSLRRRWQRRQVRLAAVQRLADLRQPRRPVA